MVSNATADVIVPTRSRGALIESSLTSILQSNFSDFTLWIVDQSDDDITKQTVAPHAQADPRVRYLRVSSRGSNGARNDGARAGQAPFILFTDDDCRVHADWLRAMITELADEATWAVFGRVAVDETTRMAHSSDSRPVSPALKMAIKSDGQRRVYERNRLNLGFGHGANMGFRRDRYTIVRGFDEMLGTGGVFRSWPERDIGYRILRRDGRIVYTPDAVVYHRQWRGWPEVRRTYGHYALGAGAAIGKYVRSGDLSASYLLAEWLLDQGVRQVLSGVIKWRSWQKVYVGLLQLVLPWIGLAQSWRYPIDRVNVLYRYPAGKPAETP